MSYRDYLQLSPFSKKGIDISLDENMDLDSIRIYGLLRCLVVPDQLIDLGNIRHHLNKLWRINDLQKTIEKLRLYRYIAIECKSNKRYIYFYHTPMDVIQLYQCSVSYMSFVENTCFEYTDQLYAHQCAISITDYLASLDEISVELDSSFVPCNSNNLSTQNEPCGSNNLSALDEPRGSNNLSALDEPCGSNNLSALDEPCGLKNIDTGNLNPKLNNLRKCGSIPQLSEDLVNDSSDLSGMDGQISRICEPLNPVKTPENTKNPDIAMGLKENEKYLNLGIDSKKITRKTTDTTKLVSQSVSNNTYLPTHRDIHNNYKDSTQPNSQERIEDYHYEIDELDWYYISLSLSHFIFKSFKDHKIIKQDAQRIINVIEHYHKTEQKIHSYQALLLKLFKAAKDKTLFDPTDVNVRTGESESVSDNNKRAELISHTVTYQTLVEDYSEEIAIGYLNEHGLHWDGARLYFVEDTK